MSLNEVNWSAVLADPATFPPDLEVVASTSDPTCSVLRQRFACHRLLLSVSSPVLHAELRRLQGSALQLQDTNPQAFAKVLEFIYHRKPFRVHNGELGSSFQFAKLVLDVLDLAAQLQLPKLVRFCEEVAEQKVVVTSTNCGALQALLCSSPLVTVAARSSLILKFRSVARRQLARRGVTAAEMAPHLEREVAWFTGVSAAGPGNWGGSPSHPPPLHPSSHPPPLHPSSLRGSSPPRAASLASSLHYHASSMVFHESPAFSPPLASTPTPQPSSPVWASSQASHTSSPPRRALTVVSSTFLGCSSPPQAGNLFDCYSSAAASVPGIVPSLPTTPGPADPTHEEIELEDVLALVTNFRSLDRVRQEELVDYIKRKERDDPEMVASIKKRARMA